MIYTFSDSEWELIDKAWRHVERKVSGITRARVNAVLASMQMDHAIYTAKQLELVIWILRVVSGASHVVISKKSRRNARLTKPPGIQELPSSLKDKMAQLLAVLQYYHDANREHDLRMYHKR